MGIQFSVLSPALFNGDLFISLDSLILGKKLKPSWLNLYLNPLLPTRKTKMSGWHKPSMLWEPITGMPSFVPWSRSRSRSWMKVHGSTRKQTVYGFAQKQLWQRTWLLQKIWRRMTLPMNRLYPLNTTNFWTSSTRNELVDSLINDPGITRSIWNQILNQNRSKTTISHQQNKSNWTTSWRKLGERLHLKIWIPNGITIFLC